ncbi:4-diphosphocytidyl-2C-methyl-D-erythritol kinase [Candidatus Acidianus copahuensis]|uniref:4-diphosphocytidyl-2C-methyl-D-erythritol kinase n=1 Tax=Candidatus Acidianus copahuensis TaxID=1160895 RepID=A0A031LSP2_9CREN|nr:nucleotidyltransferase family protein [Candidatus Acidianus copahuensis]EZQ10841.1 4-diphosphocytidyl-2C-methyl-D-erythritol kinase [Candidatus Acidianus copahuensis]
MKIGAVILAAGEGKRFGSNKLLANIKGKVVVQYVLDAVNMERVIVVGKYAKDLVEVIKNDVVIYNPRWSEGISTSLKLGIRFFLDYDGVLVALGDMPFITRETVNSITSKFSNECEAVVPTYRGMWGNPVILSKSLFPDVMKIEGDIGAKVVLRQREKICKVELGEEVVKDIDTISDLPSS